MKLSEVREVIRQVIAEAKEEKNGGKKSTGKLVDLKKEMEGLKKMKESLGSFQIAEGGEQSFVAEYAHMQKYVNEYNKLKEAHAKLSEMLDGQINEVDGKIKSETEKIKEMMGLIEKAKKEPKEKKADKGAKSKHEKGETKAEEKEEHEAEDKKKSKELDEARFEKGEDVGEKGKNFAKIAKSAGKKYGSEEAGKKVAGAVLKKVLKKEELDTKKVYGGIGQNQGATGSSLQFTVTENTPEYFEIDFTLTPNSKYRQAGAGSKSPREKEYGYAKISKKDFNGQITVKGENFNIGKDFITNNL